MPPLKGFISVGGVDLGTYAGFNATILSPSPLGISQKIAELPMFSGMVYAWQSISLFYLLPFYVLIGT